MTTITCETIMIRPLWGLQSIYSTEGGESGSVILISDGILVTVELWSLELACLEHQESLELVCRSRQFPYTFNVKIHPRLEQRWLELKTRSAGGFFHVKTL